MASLTKREARKIVQGRLSQLPQSDYLLAVSTVHARVYALLAGLLSDGKLLTVLSYRAAPKWYEVDLSTLGHELCGVQFDYVPPEADAALPVRSYDAVLVPLHGFNTEGYRLGRGGGWYDTFLASQPRAYKIGVGLKVLKVDFAPEAHDIPMDTVVTERDLLKFDRSI